MGWSLGFDHSWQRDVGYGVPAFCDHPGCGKEIDRGLAHLCGDDLFGGERGCGLYFCAEHLWMPRDISVKGWQCERCRDFDWQGEEQLTPFDPSPEHWRWMHWKLTDDDWASWRNTHPHVVQAYRIALLPKGNPPLEFCKATITEYNGRNEPVYHCCRLPSGHVLTDPHQCCACDFSWFGPATSDEYADAEGQPI